MVKYFLFCVDQSRLSQLMLSGTPKEIKIRHWCGKFIWRSICMLMHLRHKSFQEALFSAMKPVVSLMMEVELKEEAAERAKAEAEKAGAHILYKVQELKQMLQHAREANDMVIFHL